MGISSNPPHSTASGSNYHTHKVYLLTNYILLGAATSCIFLTLSLRLVPSVSGLLLILLHALTIASSVSACALNSASSARRHAAHMAATVLAAIFQGSVALLIFTRTDDFLGGLRSYVREEDGAVILKMVGGLCIAIFCLEWVVLALAFVMRFYSVVEGGGPRDRQEEEAVKDWPWPFQV